MVLKTCAELRSYLGDSIFYTLGGFILGVSLSWLPSYFSDSEEFEQPTESLPTEEQEEFFDPPTPSKAFLEPTEKESKTENVSQTISRKDLLNTMHVPSSFDDNLNSLEDYNQREQAVAPETFAKTAGLPPAFMTPNIKKSLTHDQSASMLPSTHAATMRTPVLHKPLAPVKRAKTTFSGGVETLAADATLARTLKSFKHTSALSSVLKKMNPQLLLQKIQEEDLTDLLMESEDESQSSGGLSDFYGTPRQSLLALPLELLSPAQDGFEPQSLDQNLLDLFVGMGSVDGELKQIFEKLDAFSQTIEDQSVKNVITEAVTILRSSTEKLDRLVRQTDMTQTQAITIREFLMDVQANNEINAEEREVAKFITTQYLSRTLHQETGFSRADSLEQFEAPDIKELHKSESYMELKNNPRARPNYKVGMGKWLEDPVSKFLNKIPTWNFDVFEFEDLVGPDLVMPLCGVKVLREMLKMKFINRVQIAEEILFEYLVDLSKRYYSRSKVPYHNALHATDVMLTHFSFMQSYAFENFEFVDVLASILAGAAHDVEHNGFNNTFHINSGSDLALRYNDRSVLENHHCAVGWRLLLNHEHNFFKMIPESRRRVFRNVFTNCILATDMSVHGEDLNFLDSFVQNNDCSVPLDATTAPKILPRVLHTADISNVSKDFVICDTWVTLLMREFFAQGDIEKQQGLSVSPLCDRDVTDINASEVGFLKFIVKPWFQKLFHICPDLKQVPMQNIHLNYCEYKNRALASKEKEGDELSRSVLVRRDSDPGSNPSRETTRRRNSRLLKSRSLLCDSLVDLDEFRYSREPMPI